MLILYILMNEQGVGYEKRDYFVQKINIYNKFFISISCMQHHHEYTCYASYCNLFHLTSCLCCRENASLKYNDTWVIDDKYEKIAIKLSHVHSK